jgi:hypothetical protein
MIVGGSEIVTATFPEDFCSVPVVVATGDETVTLVQVGSRTPSTVSFIALGTDGPARIFWQAVPSTEMGQK